jgi:hypothetical protein
MAMVKSSKDPAGTNQPFFPGSTNSGIPAIRSVILFSASLIVENCDQKYQEEDPIDTRRLPRPEYINGRSKNSIK